MRKLFTIFCLCTFLAININARTSPFIGITSPDSEDIYVYDIGNFFSANDVENVLQEIGADMFTLIGSTVSFDAELSALATTYLGIDGANANQQLNIGIYGLRLSSGIFGISSIEWADGSEQVSSPTAGVTDHTLLSNIGTNAHSVVDTHVASVTTHLDWATSAGTIHADNYSNTQNEVLYDIVIATYAGTGIDFSAVEFSSYSANHAFQAAHDAATIGQTIWVKPGAYVISSSWTSTTPGLQWLTAGATIYQDPTHEDVNSDVTATGFYVDGVGTIIDGFFFNGNAKMFNFITINASYCKIKNVTALNIGNATTAGFLGARGISIAGGTQYFEGNNILLQDIDAKGSPLIDSSDFSKWINITLIRANSITNADAMKISSMDSIFQNIFLDGCNRFVISGDRNNVVGLTVVNAAFTNGHGFTFGAGAEFNTLTGFVIDDCTISYGVLILDGNNTISNGLIRNAGGTGDNHDGMLITGSENTTVSNVTFTGNMDRYGLSIDATSPNCIISNVKFIAVTGETAEFLDSATGTRINNVTSDSQEIIQKVIDSTTFYANLTVNGTFYYNASLIEAYMNDNILFTTTTADSSAFYPIEGDLTTEHVIGFTMSGSSLIYTGLGGPAKNFHVTASISVKSNTANTITHWHVFLNGVAQADIFVRERLRTASDVLTVPMSGIEELSEGDILQIRVSADKAVELTTEHINFNIHQID